MLLLAHAGLTLGAALFLSSVLISNNSSDIEEDNAETSPSLSLKTPEPSSTFSNRAKQWFPNWVRHINVKPLLLGALLPDIIDKPLGIYLSRKVFSDGRIFCHTLLFPILVTGVGLISNRRREKTWHPNLTFGVLTHLILDEMWQTPNILLWPLRGTIFKKEDASGWGKKMLRDSFTDPKTYVPELLGAGILIWFALKK